MKRGLILQERDFELLRFLAQYKTITLDNCRYIYKTKTYQEKRICNLVKEKYITRLKHREITLGLKGKEELNKLGVEIKDHCRNSSNMERLKIISDIAAFIQFSNTMNFLPSWAFKDKSEPTNSSRRYLGATSFNNDTHMIYSICGNKSKNYITSIYYDLKKEKNFYNSIIFTDDINKVLNYKKKFYFSNSHLYLVPYNDFSKRILVNYDKIKEYMFKHLSKKHEVQYTDFESMDFLVDNELYLKIMLFLDLNQINSICYTLCENPKYLEKFYFICFEENAKFLHKLIKNCNILVVEESTVENYITNDKI